MKKSCSISAMEFATSVRIIHDSSGDLAKFGLLMRSRTVAP